MSILIHTTIDDDISSHASNLNLNTQPNPTPLNTQATSANKRSRYTSSQSGPDEPTYIFLNTPVNEPSSTTHANLQKALSTINLPSNLLSSPIAAWCTTSALHADKKLVFVQLHDPSYTNHILCAIRNLIKFSKTQISSTLPLIPTIDDINISPHNGLTSQ